MPDPSNRLPINAPGRFYVDDTCTDCDLCREVAPMIFARNADLATSFVLRQPLTESEIALAEEAASSCPCGTIGNDG